MKRTLQFVGALFFHQLSVRTENEDIYVVRNKGNEVCAISYIFDDGLAEHYTIVVPRLEKRGFNEIVIAHYRVYVTISKITMDKQKDIKLNLYSK